MENDTRQPSMDLLEAFQMVIPYLNRLVHEDITVGVYDHEKLLLNVPASTFSIDVKKGDPLVEGDIVTEAIRQNNDQVQIVPKELFGFPLMARAIPLHDEQGNVIGGVGVGISLEKANELFLVADSLSAIVEQTAASLEEIAKSVTILADQVSDSNNMIVRVIDGAEEIGTISSVVKGISDQSNLLGLNAAIEAARAGDHGKGFSVVAEEIRKLALNSKENVNEIEQIMKKIKEAVENLQLSFTDIHSLTTSQAATIEELSATVQEINRNAQNLSEMAERSLKN